MKVSLEGLKVVTAQEMARIEKLSIEAGASAEHYMLTAAKNIAEHVMYECERHDYPQRVVLLVGKGNNGGDAYAVGLCLLKKRYDVKAFCVFKDKECSELNQKYRKAFSQAGGVIHTFTASEDFPATGIIIDGLFGTGFTGEITALVKQLIEKANASGLPIFSIDIPSGLHGTTGKVQGAAITAKITYYLGLPKLGFFLRDGYEKVGQLQQKSFGMEEAFVEQAKEEAFLVTEKSMPRLLPKIKRTRHKYERGYTLVFAGSKGMPGAALLASLATLRAGAGIVRLFHPEGMEEVLSASFEELIKTPWSPLKDQQIFEEMQRAESFLIGPGLGRTEEVKQEVIKILSQATIPCIIDADAVEIFAKHIFKHSQGIILTPHKKEMLRCLECNSSLEDEEMLMRCQQFADQRSVTIVLKGAPTWIFHPHAPKLIVPRGDPGMATAGSGDVLGGIIAALLAQGLPLREGATLGVYLHALAGEMAALAKTSYSVIASDLIEYLPAVFRQMQAY